MRLSLKIALALLAAAAVLGTAMAYIVLGARNIEHAHKAVQERSLPMIDATEELRYNALRILSVTNTHILDVTIDADPDPRALGEAVRDFRAALVRFSGTVDALAPELGETRDAIRGKGAALEILATQIQNDMSYGAGASYQVIEQGRLRDLEAALIRDIGGVIAAERVRLATGERAVAWALRMERLAATGCIIVFLAMVGAIWAMARRTIVLPLQVLTRAAKRVGQGDFVPPPEHRSGDEIGLLSRAFRRMVAEIEALVTDAAAGKAAVMESEERFRDFAEASSDWLWETDANGNFSFFSDRFTALTGFAPAAMIGEPLGALMTTGGSDPRRIELESRRALRNLDCEYTDAEGRQRHCRLSGRAVVSADGAFLGYRGTATDTTDEVAAIRKAEHLSLHDALTGLPNRLLFGERLSQSLSEGARNGTDVAVLFIDLDRFKEVNDTLGHEVGDRLLVSAAERLAKAAGPRDTVARLGGDEFAVVQVDEPQPTGAEALCTRIITALTQPFDVAGDKLQTGASIGVALATGGTESEAGLLRDADIAMYRAKADGRGLYRFHDESMNVELQRRRDMEAALREAIRQDALELHYQPLYDTETRSILGVEALLRWPRPGQSSVPPSDFIPLAEETGLILPLGEWVLRTACEAALDWPGLIMAVNLSALQFLDDDLLPQVAGVLRETGLDPWRLELEITESVLLDQTDAAIFQLDALRDLGVRIVMDDFGTGYSSLSYLQRFHFDKIKLDRSFVAGIEHSGHSAAIVRTVLQLGRALGVETLAEGVETERQVSILASEGCDQLQGFYFSRALPREELGALIAEARPLAGTAQVAPPGPAPG